MASDPDASRVSGYPLPGWITRSIASTAAISGPTLWTVKLERETPDHKMRTAFATGRSEIGLLEAWDMAIKMAEEHPVNGR